MRHFFRELNDVLVPLCAGICGIAITALVVVGCYALIEFML